MSEFINNQSLRKAKLKEALLQIHQGKPYEEVKAVFREILSNATAGEIAEIEQTLISEGLPVEDIQYLCDVHVAMFRESLDQQVVPEMTPGHPVYTFRAENELAALALNDSRLALERYKAQPNGDNRQKLLDSLRKLKTYDNHYLRKENLLFPYLEKYGFSGPSNVMWGIHDDVRKGWKQMIAILESNRPDSVEIAKEVADVFTPIENAIREMFYKEENILIPNSLERLSEDDWRAIYNQEDDFGFSFAVRGTDWPEANVQKSPDKDTIMPNQQTERIETMSDYPLTHGDLTIKQIDMMLKNLPVDITFVDENDTVRYYSESP